MKSILVTGGAGFIGSVVCRHLIEKKCQVVTIDNFNDYYSPALKQYRWSLLPSTPNITKIEGDICNSNTLDTLFEAHSFDAVINLAAMAGVRNSIENPREYIDVNVSGLVNVLESMRKHNVTQLIQASTSSLYAGKDMPFNENLDVRSPISPYAASKLGAEALTYSYYHIHGINTTVLRYFTVYGPAGRPDMAPYKFAQWILNDVPIQIYGDGHQTRDFTHVEDIARGTVIAALSVRKGWDVINLGGGMEPVSIINFISILEDSLLSKAKIIHCPPVEGDMRHTSADIRKAANLLNWKPALSLEDGLKTLAHWHLKRYKQF